MAQAAFKYDTDNLDGGRFILLNEIRQAPPEPPLEVTRAEMRKSSSGGEFPVLILTDADGNEYAVAAWKRDVKECLKQWGAKPDDWGQVAIVKSSTGTRYEIKPHGEKPAKSSKV